MLNLMNLQKNENDQQTMTARLRSVGLVESIHGLLLLSKPRGGDDGQIVAGQLMIISANESIRIRIEENC